MITALDHFVLICPDIDEGAAIYETLLGKAPDWRAEDEKGGSATALFQLGNTALELMAPQGDGPVATRLREMLAETGPCLTSLAFRSDALDADHHLFKRRGLDPSDISTGSSDDMTGKGRRSWRRFRCPDEVCGGVKTFVLQQDSTLLVPALPPAGAVQSLDHIVINTPNPERALIHYGARLGLDFRLDRTAEQWKTRFLFFRTGGLTFEVIHRLEERHEATDSDTIWGLTWAVSDLQGAHDRLAHAGVSVSEIRKGRKPGSTVFTVRDKTLGVPTLFIAHEAR